MFVKENPDKKKKKFSDAVKAEFRAMNIVDLQTTAQIPVKRSTVAKKTLRIDINE